MPRFTRWPLASARLGASASAASRGSDATVRDCVRRDGVRDGPASETRARRLADEPPPSDVLSVTVGVCAKSFKTSRNLDRKGTLMLGKARRLRAPWEVLR